MARLPIVGDDNGTWGAILNDFLGQAHASDGALKAGSVGELQLRPQAVTSSAILDGSIEEAKLSQSVTAKLNAIGTDAREVELNVTETHIVWRFIGDPIWVPLVALANLTGPQGPPGVAGTFAGTLDDISAGVTNRHFTTSDETKLDGIAVGASANSTDAALLSRPNHTGTQTASTISDFGSAADTRIAAATDLVRTSGAQTVAGTKTFVAAPVVPDGAFTISKVTGLQATLDSKAETSIGSTIQGSNYTLTMSDAGCAVEVSNASARTVTVPANSDVAFPIGTIVEVARLGAGSVTLAAASGVTLHTAGSLTLRAQYSVLSLRKRAADEWLVAGDTT